MVCHKTIQWTVARDADWHAVGLQFGDIEQLVLSGGLFNGQSRSSSPERSPSPDGVAQWPPGSPSAYTDKELFGESDNESEPGQQLPPGAEQQQQPQQESIGMGPGRTGVKGVIRDRDGACLHGWPCCRLPFSSIPP